MRHWRRVSFRALSLLVVTLHLLLGGCALGFQDRQGAGAMLLVASADQSPIQYQIEQADPSELAAHRTSIPFKIEGGFRQSVIETTSEEPFLFKVDTFRFVYACKDGYFAMFAAVQKKEPHTTVTLRCER
jgi:hypothetical protein